MAINTRPSLSNVVAASHRSHKNHDHNMPFTKFDKVFTGILIILFATLILYTLLKRIHGLK
jgi:hypothetical protein